MAALESRRSYAHEEEMSETRTQDGNAAVDGSEQDVIDALLGMGTCALLPSISSLTVLLLC